MTSSVSSRVYNDGDFSDVTTDNLFVNENAILNSTTVTGQAIMDENLLVKGGLTVNQNTSLTGPLTVSGLTSLNSLAVSGTSNIGNATANNLTVTGSLHSNSTNRVLAQYSGSGISANVSVGDHIQFNTINFASTGSTIAVDVTSPYTTSVGPSIGRITLPANGNFYLASNISDLQGAGLITNQSLFLTFYDVNNNIPLSVLRSNTSVDRFVLFNYCYVAVGPTPLLVELRVTFNHNITSYNSVSLSIEQLQA